MSPTERDSEGRPVFYYDLNSPYAWLAAERIESLLPRAPVWRPIAYAFVIRHTGRTPWSLKPGREARMQEIERRAARRGLPTVRWPSGWPTGTFSLPALRTATYAARLHMTAAFSRAAFREQFTAGRGLDDLDTMLGLAAACGLDREAVAGAIEQTDVKEELRRATEEAIAAGVTGIPTVRVADQLFWGDDKLEDAARALTARARST